MTRVRQGDHEYECVYGCGFECDTEDEMDDHYAWPCTDDEGR